MKQQKIKVLKIIPTAVDFRSRRAQSDLGFPATIPRLVASAAIQAASKILTQSITIQYSVMFIS